MTIGWGLTEKSAKILHGSYETDYGSDYERSIM